MCMWTKTTRRSLTFLAFFFCYCCCCCCWWCECASPPPAFAVTESLLQQNRQSVLAENSTMATPDVTKFNVSQTEYTRMMTIYLERLEATNPTSKSVLKLFTYEYSERREKQNRRRIQPTTRLHFSINGSWFRGSNTGVEVVSATLRMLSPPLTAASGDARVPNSVKAQVYQVLTGGRRRLLDYRQVYLSQSAPKWIEFDVSRGVRAWAEGDRNLGLKLVCPECLERNGTLAALRLSPPPTINALAYVNSKANRTRRAAGQPVYSKNRRTECGTRNASGKPRCCRHKMPINFKDIQGMENIIQPKTFDAGYCQGRCRSNDNFAHNHAKIQWLMWQRNHTLPRLCCAPSTLADLEVLTIDNNDPTKLNVKTWDNVSVLECACS